MDKFPKEMLIEIALYLDMEGIIKFCKTNKRVNSVVCENENFWRQKLLKDYPNHDSLSQFEESYRNKYRRINAFHESIHTACRKFLNHFFGKSQRYMDKAKYFKDFTDAAIEIYIYREKLNEEDYSDYLGDFAVIHEYLYPSIINNVHSQRVKDIMWDSPDDPRNFLLDKVNFSILSEK